MKAVFKCFTILLFMAPNNLQLAQINTQDFTFVPYENARFDCSLDFTGLRPASSRFASRILGFAQPSRVRYAHKSCTDGGVRRVVLLRGLRPLHNTPLLTPPSVAGALPPKPPAGLCPAPGKEVPSFPNLQLICVGRIPFGHPGLPGNPPQRGGVPFGARSASFLGCPPPSLSPPNRATP